MSKWFVLVLSCSWASRTFAISCRDLYYAALCALRSRCSIGVVQHGAREAYRDHETARAKSCSPREDRWPTRGGPASVIRFKYVGVKVLISHRYDGAMARCRPQDSDGNSYLRSHGAKRVSDILSARLLTILRYRRYCTIPRIDITVFSMPMTLGLSKHYPRKNT